MTTGQRFLVTIFIVLAIMFALSLCGYRYWEPKEQASTFDIFKLASAESTPVELPPCMDSATREKIRNIMYEAIDEALKEHIMKMYDVWMKDDRGQPGRAATGVRQGIKAYLGARMGVDKWDPPPCGG